MKNSPAAIRPILHYVNKDTKARTYCGEMSIAALSGVPTSVARDALRMARHGRDWPSRVARSPTIKGVHDWELEKALYFLGFVGHWVNVRHAPTLAAWLNSRTRFERDRPCIVVVRNHYVAIAGHTFADTSTKGHVVEIDEAPHRRKRVMRIFIVTGRVAPTAIVSKHPAPRISDYLYRDFVKFARRQGATWHKERGDENLTIRLRDGRTLIAWHWVLPDDWCTAQRQLEDFLSSATPAPDRFEQSGENEWYATVS